MKTFEQWYADYLKILFFVEPEREELARTAWNAAIYEEQERCALLAQRVVDDGQTQGFLVAHEIRKGTTS